MAYQSSDTIHDYPSFKAVTAERLVARLYFFALLDPLLDVAYKVSCDFFRRPSIYTKLDSHTSGDPTATSVSELIAKLHARSGASELFLSTDQRSQIYLPIFGHTLGSPTIDAGTFPQLRDDVIKAAAAYAEHAPPDTGLGMLRERMRATARTLAVYFAGLQGDSLKWSADQALSGLTEEVCYAILRNSGVAAVFGITTAPKASWPYSEDANGDKLVEAIATQLKTMLPATASEIGPTRFSSLQRAAVRGAEAIATIVDFDEATDDDMDRLITQVYTWGAALSGLNADAQHTQPSPSGTLGAAQHVGRWPRISTSIA